MDEILPFKYGLQWSGDPIAIGEEMFDFRFPSDWIKAYGTWCAGTLDGWMFFDTDVSYGLAVSTFLGPFDSQNMPLLESQSMLAAIRKSPFLSKFSPKRLPYIPTAVIDLAVDDRAGESAFSKDSLICLSRADSSVVALHSSTGEQVHVAATFADWLQSCEFWFQFQDPEEEYD